jgi:aspartate carbamoyltransferase catalytic subunit
VPILNGGDGGNQHPSQTFLDLYTIAKLFPELLDGGRELAITFAGDLRYGRTVHSLLTALCHFRVRLQMVAPRGLEMPPQYLQQAAAAGLTVTNVPNLQEAIAQSDILYMTRLQEERFPDPLEFGHIKASYRITAAMLTGAPERLRILHPLPRINEIAVDVDRTAHAHYFPQAGNGIPVRQALLGLVLGAL